MDRLYHGLLLRAPRRSAPGLWPASVIRTPVLRFEMRRVRGRPIQHLPERQNWASDKGEVILFPVNPDWSLETHWKHMLEDVWTFVVLPELRKRGLDQGELLAVQILYPPGQEPVVRFNEQIRARLSLGVCHKGSAAWLDSVTQVSQRGLVFWLSRELGTELLRPARRVFDIELLDGERGHYGHFTCLRVGNSWQGLVDFVGLLPQSVQDVIETWDRSPFSPTLISARYGDDLAKAQLLRQLDVDICSLPGPLKEETPNLVYASVFRAYDDTPIQQMPSVISHRIREEVSREKGSLAWDEFPDYADRLTISREQASELKQAAEQWFAAAGLTKKERDILGLNLTLVCSDEKWTRQQKADYLNMSRKNYEKHLGRARITLRVTRRKPMPRGYECLLDEIFRGVDKK